MIELAGEFESTGFKSVGFYCFTVSSYYLKRFGIKMLFKRQKSNLTPTFNAIQRMGLCIRESYLSRVGFREEFETSVVKRIRLKGVRVK